jgi:hypothetical protein
MASAAVSTPDTTTTPLVPEKQISYKTVFVAFDFQQKFNKGDHKCIYHTTFAKLQVPADINVEDLDNLTNLMKILITTCFDGMATAVSLYGREFKTPEGKAVWGSDTWKCVAYNLDQNGRISEFYLGMKAIAEEFGLKDQVPVERGGNHYFYGYICEETSSQERLGMVSIGFDLRKPDTDHVSFAKGVLDTGLHNVGRVVVFTSPPEVGGGQFREEDILVQMDLPTL